MDVQLPILGGCLCRAARYQLTGPPLLAYACHCTDCQTQSGSAFALAVVLKSETFSVTRGEIERVSRVTPMGRSLDVSFCAACRTRLHARATLSSEFISLRAGTLDDARWVTPIAQFYTQSALPWAVLEQVRQVEPDDFNFAELARAWAAVGPNFVDGETSGRK